MVGRRSSLQAVEIAYLIRKASDTRITLVKNTLCLVPESQAQASQRVAPHTESEEFLEVMSMDQRAGVWPVEEGGSSRQQRSSSS